MIAVYKIMFRFKRALGCDLFSYMSRLTKNETSALSRASCRNLVQFFQATKAPFIIYWRCIFYTFVMINCSLKDTFFISSILFTFPFHNCHSNVWGQNNNFLCSYAYEGCIYLIKYTLLLWHFCILVNFKIEFVPVMQNEFSASLNQSSELDDPLEICLGLEMCYSRNISSYY